MCICMHVGGYVHAGMRMWCDVGVYVCLGMCAFLCSVHVCVCSVYVKVFAHTGIYSHVCGVYVGVYVCASMCARVCLCLWRSQVFLLIVLHLI